MEILFILCILVVVPALFVKCRRLYYKSHPDKLAQLKGKQGERLVRKKLGKSISYKKCVYNDMVIQDGNMTCQIDHIVVNKNGIFVIETKNYSGSIFGDDHSQQWCQILAYGNLRNHFYNPVKQNATHIYRLNKVLNNMYPIRGIVVFVSGNIECISSDSVITLRQLRRAISMPVGVQLTSQDIEDIRIALDCADVSSTISRQTHIDNIHKMQEDIDDNICPRCGGTLVLRSGKYGQFYGCSNYPSCKFIKKDNY